MNRLLAACIAFAVALTAAAQSQPTTAKSDAGRDRARAEARKLLENGAKFLVSAQSADGSWNGDTGIGITCLALRALVQHPPAGPGNATVQRGVEWVVKQEREDGTLYSPDGLVKNYETSVALSMFAALGDDKHKAVMERMQKALLDGQWDENDGKSIDDPFYGGAGYGRGKRPDLSNLQFMLDALKDSGLPKDHPAYKKALVFVSRCQMLGEHNDQTFAKNSTDGGFIYSPANGGESKAGEVQVGDRTELRTYGSMTYAGFKSMLYAGLTKDDGRVKAALDWIGQHWTLEFNPNMPEKQSKEGLYYYYLTFARALGTWNEPIVRDKAGREHDWRSELVERLAKLQKDDGSWVNEADRWMEGSPALTTAYSMIALQAAFPELARDATKR